VQSRVIVIASSPPVLDGLRFALGDDIELVRVELSSAEEVIADIEAAGAVDGILCEFTSARASEQTVLVQLLVERFAPLPVIGLGVGDDSRLPSMALRVRARDFVVFGRDDETEIARRIVVQLPGPRERWKLNKRMAWRQGKRYVIVSGHPYDGIAFLAVHLAIALQERVPRDARVLIVDLATPQGAAGVLLNLHPNHSVLDALALIAKDEAPHIGAFSTHSSSVAVLGLPESLRGRPTIETGVLSDLLDSIGDTFAHVVITLDGLFPIGTLANVIGRAHHTLLLSDQSILKTRQSRHLVEALRAEGCTLDRTGLVIDNYKHRLGLEPQNIAELFGLPSFGTLCTERYNRIVAMNAGEPLFTLAPEDPYCGGVRNLAALLLGEPRIMEEPASIGLKRLLARMGLVSA
jgi:pilus assembly protein CpaE